ncbi:MAG: HisA/HisF-related TIM barrel protein [Bacteroidota bacterium]|nr:HisA/HisF-related TIM barrel protein [Bacteroidota bacterium]
MNRTRVIPVITIIKNKMVKTVKFKNPHYIGDPLNAIKIFNEKRVDELIILDIEASKNQKEPNYKLIEEMAGEAFMPLGYGGGIHTFEQAAKIFALGIEKVILNSVLHNNPDIISKIAEVYGNQSVVVCLDYKKNIFGKWKCHYFSGTKSLSNDPRKLIESYIKKGAGEIIIHNIEKEGTFQGFDLQMISKLSNIAVPIVALGGCNGIDDMKTIIQQGANAVASGSFFCYKNNNTQSILINYPQFI